ncbi:NIPA-like protein 2 [Verticillium nonalfalfae]|uniref:NIPA-like protein 2 n=1 Tax=Verticillium nonalfalfae TaxID=1051616 RepID=A0A3M9Y526_9PEZI|nr:NIPA-like protein 2 [Verticillium nonalfalfae]RNJ55381.1 NIPA-like protein 2 [Verticillium nonalfalfae]
MGVLGSFMPNIVPGPGFIRREDSGSDDNNGDLQNWSSLIGITTAIVGNVLIALALNVQRYAHIRLHRERRRVRRRAKEALRSNQDGVNGARGAAGGTYGTLGTPQNHAEDETYFNGNHAGNGTSGASDSLTRSFRSEDSTESDSSGDDEEQVASTYLKSPYWWAGQILITLGELGNFLAYGFAPASIVSPLGVVALISNCIIAPIFFKEVFRQRDFWGVIIATGGVVTVVLSAKQEETKLDPHDVWDHITTIEFKVYLAVTVTLIAILMWASPRYGHRTILVDLGLVGLFGGYTALSTKGVSSMLSSTLLGAFKTPVTYVLLFILLFTAVMQVRYVNKALQRFPSTQVIPIQFVTFTLCVIVGSAVLYRDFERTSGEQAGKFIGGCLLTFFGVFLVTSGRPGEDEEESYSEIDGEETIGLARHDSHHSAQHPSTPGGASSSRRSSKVSHASIFQTDMQHDSGKPTLRRPSINPPRTPGESAPLLSNPWVMSGDESPVRGVRTISEDAVASMMTPSEPATPFRDGLGPMSYTAEPQLTTPRHLSVPASQRPQSSKFSGPFFSPSPLSSTVSAVVKDTLLRNADNPLLKRPSMRRLRTSIRASLFMSEEEQQVAERRGLASRSQDELNIISDEPIQPRQEPRLASASGGTGRPRSLSDTLGELFRVKRKKRDPAEGGLEEDAP